MVHDNGWLLTCLLGDKIEREHKVERNKRLNILLGIATDIVEYYHYESNKRTRYVINLKSVPAG